MNKFKHGFTLAEVLITVVILGAVLALTLPALLNPDYKEDIQKIRQECYSQSKNQQEYNFCIEKQRYLRLGE